MNHFSIIADLTANLNALIPCVQAVTKIQYFSSLPDPENTKQACVPHCP